MLILASQSPARKALLANAGLSFEARPAHIDERAIEDIARTDGAGVRDIALSLAAAKASAVSAQDPQAFVIGADQTLEFEGEALHKPLGRAQARSGLKRLRGRTHLLHAAVSLGASGHVVWSHVESAELTLRDFADAELDHVMALEGDALLSSVGGYRLEGPSVRLFEAIRGDYFTILGLPLLPLLSALRTHAPQVFGD